MCGLVIVGVLALWMMPAHAARTGLGPDLPMLPAQLLVIFSGARDTDYEVRMETGLRRTFASDSAEAQIKVDVLYLDMMDGYESERADLQGQALVLKHGHARSYAGMLVIGRPAARFASQWRSRVAPDVPVAVAGLFPEVRNIPGPGVHAFDVRPGFAQNAALIGQMLPKVRHLLVINGLGDQDQVVAQMARAQLADLGSRFQVTYVNQSTAEELSAKVARLPADTVILYGAVTRDLTGPLPRLQWGANARRISRAASVPMFCVLENAIDYGGCVTGYVIGGERTGHQVAESIKQLLANPDATLSPVARPPMLIEGHLVAQWEALRRWGLSVDQLPEGADVRGQPLSLMETHPLQLAGVASVVLVLSVGMGVLINALRVNRRQQLRLAEQEQRWAFALESAGHGVWDWRVRTGEVSYSAGWLQLLGLADVEPTPRTRVERVHPDDAVTVEAAVEHWLRDRGHEARGCEFRLRHADGSYRWVLERARVVERDAVGLPLRVVATVEDIGERRAHLERIHHLATHDVLTGLPNRSLLDDRLHQELRHARRKQGRFAVVFLDLDHFKTVNDTLGHHVGDQLLAVVAHRLAQPLRETDTLTRQGGDEFVLLLSDIGEGVADVLRVCERLQASLSAPIALGGRDWPVAASMGIALYPDDADQADHLMQKADAALYRAKANGRRNICFYADTLNVALTRKLTLEARMRGAVDAGEFQVWYQPQYDLRDGTLCGAEALMRWTPSDAAAIAPDEFIPIAEEFGHIHTLGHWALSQACRQAVQWAGVVGRSLPVAVNLSAVQFRRGDLVGHVERVLRETGLPPADLVLEITESVVMEDAPGSHATMAALAALGVKLAIDDFGTGYSSLAYLKHFPVHHLKIDRTFVRDLETNPDDGVIVRMIIQLGHEMRLAVIAEGVETRAQAMRLRALGCDQIQGFLQSPAVPAQPFLSEILPAANRNSVAVAV